MKIFDWILRIITIAILGMSVFFKFTADPGSVYIFEKVGLGAPGRIGSGIVELIAVLLLLTPRYAWLGALLALGVISGAIVSHLTVLGIAVQGDGGQLFGLALVVFVCSLVILYLHRREIPVIGDRF